MTGPIFSKSPTWCIDDFSDLSKGGVVVFPLNRVSGLNNQLIARQIRNHLFKWGVWTRELCAESCRAGRTRERKTPVHSCNSSLCFLFLMPSVWHRLNFFCLQEKNSSHCHNNEKPERLERINTTGEDQSGICAQSCGRLEDPLL